MAGQPPPEALGPGSERGDGAVIYGADPGVRAYVEPPRPAWEREADRARAAGGCPRCSEVPAEVLGAITAALRAAKGGRP
jgi:hypothetical protein